MTRAAENAEIDSITLVCSCLEEGRDGVGDYCRRMAAALADMGVRCDILALNDRHVQGVIDEPRNRSHPFYSLLRLPNTMPYHERLRLARKRLSSGMPQWVSFHFVSYGFNAKGIALPELFWLPPLFRSFRLAMMLHEPWIDADPCASLRPRLIGWVQRHTLRHLIKRLAPLVLHTSNSYYQRLFYAAGIPVRLLPLFGNIPVTDGEAAWLPQIIRDATGWNLGTRSETWLFGIFGSVLPNWPAQPLFCEIRRLAQKHRKHAIVITVGTSGPGEAVLASAKRQFPDLDIVVLGRRSAAEISEFLNSVDFGISMHPRHMLGKSGTVAAMLEHGLPVICTWETVACDNETENPLIWSDMNRLEERLLASPVRVRRADDCTRIASAYLRDLGEIRA